MDRTLAVFHPDAVLAVGAQAGDGAAGGVVAVIDVAGAKKYWKISSVFSSEKSTRMIPFSPRAAQYTPSLSLRAMVTSEPISPNWDLTSLGSPRKGSRARSPP